MEMQQTVQSAVLVPHNHPPSVAAATFGVAGQCTQINETPAKHTNDAKIKGLRKTNSGGIFRVVGVIRGLSHPSRRCGRVIRDQRSVPHSLDSRVSWATEKLRLVWGFDALLIVDSKDVEVRKNLAANNVRAIRSQYSFRGSCMVA